MKITIPYRPRPMQKVLHKEIESKRFYTLVAHRRFGKTVFTVNNQLKRLLTTSRKDYRAGYVAPFRNQAKMIAWDYIKRYSRPIPEIEVNETELSIRYPNGAVYRLFGADNPDALRGGYFDDVALDEVAQMKREVWEEIIRPALADRKGSALFIGTPKGINLFKELYDYALSQIASGNKDWGATLITCEQSDAIPADELAGMKAMMSERAWRQEMMCDFTVEAEDVLIPIDLVYQSAGRTYREPDIDHAPLVFGVDVARFGNDASVIFKRRGLQAFEPVVIRNLDNMALAGRLVSEIARDRPDAVFVDAGAGAGVIDRVRQLGHNVIEVPFASAPMDNRYLNKRAEMWHDMRQWMLDGGAIPKNPVLISDLSTPTYLYNNAGKIQLEPKDKIKERLGRSPDLADALALTFSFPVRRHPGSLRYMSKDYDPLA